MSWDIVILNLSRRIENIEEVDEDILVDIGTCEGFKGILLGLFPAIACGETSCRLEGEGYSIDFYCGAGDEPFSNTIAHLYGEKAIYPIIQLCKAKGWQAFDTSLGALLDLEKPEVNGYFDFQGYLEHIMKKQ